MDFGALIRKLQGDKSADVLPWINAGNAVKQITTGKDYDVLPGISTGDKGRPGQMHLTAVPDFGVRSTPFNPTGTEQTSTRTVGSPVTTTSTNNSGGLVPAYDPYAAMRAQQASEAQSIRDRLLGRGSEIDSILNEIIGNIDSLVKDQKRRRQGQYDTDTSALIASLEAAIPEIQKAFAALGLSSSTFVGDRVDNTNQEYKRSQDAVDTAFQDDLASYGQWADKEKASARASADKARNSLDFVRRADATADNLGRFQETEHSFNNALTDFGAQRRNYTTSGDAIKALQGIGSDYDFSKIMDTFGSLAASSANTGTGGGAAQAVLDNIRGLDPKNKKKLTEVEINNPVGVATA